MPLTMSCRIWTTRTLTNCSRSSTSRTVRQINVDGHRTFATAQILLVDTLSMKHHGDSERAEIDRTSGNCAHVLHAGLGAFSFAQQHAEFQSRLQVGVVTGRLPAVLRVR